MVASTCPQDSGYTRWWRSQGRHPQGRARDPCSRVLPGTGDSVSETVAVAAEEQAPLLIWSLLGGHTHLFSKRQKTTCVGEDGGSGDPCTAGGRVKRCHRWRQRCGGPQWPRDPATPLCVPKVVNTGSGTGPCAPTSSVASLSRREVGHPGVHGWMDGRTSEPCLSTQWESIRP